MKDIFGAYERASSQALNLHKFEIFFNNNVKQQDHREIIQVL